MFNGKSEPQFKQLDEKLNHIQDKLVQIENEMLSLEKEMEILQKQEKDIVERLDWKPNQNIRRRLFETAGIDTAKYVIKHMNQVPAFNRILDILPYAVSRVSVSGGVIP